MVSQANTDDLSQDPKDRRKRPDVSIIIPIYNVESFLRECLDSVAAQTLRDIEVICVNDGSTDDSLSIMREYEASDPRFRVIDKPNGGYGNSVNRGLSEARGEYVAIVEPDDFVDAHMYEDLLMSATFGGTAADIVKCSYWNYYDFGASERPYVRRSNLMKKMPAKKVRFNVRSHWEVLYHHPSVWSAIYRRDFLEGRGIRLIEPKGAGWADNPFFFETMLQADSIVWVPGAYYFYRQTNPEASSYLKDYRLPFDRLRDIRAIVRRLDVTDPHILVCLYNREFSYIRSVLEKFGYPERDPELFALIQETLESMDPKVVFGAKRGLNDVYVDYYKCVMGYSLKRFHRRAPSCAPRACVVVPMLDCRPVLLRCLKSIARQHERGLEVICVDLGSNDRSLEITQEVSCVDRRFRTVSLGSNSLLELLRAVRDESSARLVCLVDPRDSLGDHHVSALLRAFAGSSADAALVGRSFPYVHSGGVSADFAGAVDVANHFSELCASLGGSASHLALSRPLLEALCEDSAASVPYSYPILALLALRLSGSVALAITDEPVHQTYRLMDSPLALIDRPGGLNSPRLLGACGQLAKMFDKGDDRQRQAIRCLVVELCVQDLVEAGDAEERGAYLAALPAALEPFTLEDAAPLDFANIASSQVVMESLRSSIVLASASPLAARPAEVLRSIWKKAVRRGRRSLPNPLYRALRRL